MEYMRSRGVTVYLSASIPTLCRRLLRARVKRPLVAGKTAEELDDCIAGMLAQREPYYRQADYTFDAEQYESTHSVDEAVQRLSQLMRGEAGDESAE